ncbi:MAG: hypothetical protein ABH950_03145 [Candidatus Altiarchaeota archaeon]
MTNIIWSSKILTALFFVVILSSSLLVAGRLNYPSESLTWTQYPQRLESKITLCIEGDSNPQEPVITLEEVEGFDPPKTVFIRLGKSIKEFHRSDFGNPQKATGLFLGCNNISFSSDEPGGYKLKLTYSEQWKPKIRAVEIEDLQSNELAKYTIVVLDKNLGQAVNKTEFVISERDIYSEDTGKVVLNETFEGNEAFLKIVVPGNYRFLTRVFDGVLWSEWYRAQFTCHVVSNSLVLRPDAFESKKPVRPKFSIPSAIVPNEDSFIIAVKREINGLYTLYHKTRNYLGYQRYKFSQPR